MEKALRRQVDADIIDIDTEEGLARYAYFEPVEIDFEAIDRASASAGYTLIELKLEITGDVTVSNCATCGQDASFLRIPATGQVFELDGSISPGKAVRVNALVQAWRADHSRLIVE